MAQKKTAAASNLIDQTAPLKNSGERLVGRMSKAVPTASTPSFVPFALLCHSATAASLLF